MFEIGKVEELVFINCMNLYFIDVVGIEVNIIDGGYNLELFLQCMCQGLLVVDYFLFGLGEDNVIILSVYIDVDNGVVYCFYFLDLCIEMKLLLEVVQVDWVGGYDVIFVENDGNLVIVLIDCLVNDFIFYYEKYLCVGKIGILAGVFFGGELFNNVEVFYVKNLVWELVLILFLVV